MKIFFEVIENKPIQVTIGLLFFHFTLAGLMSWVSYSPYFIDFHNSNGIWHFAQDSTLYHIEAVAVVELLNSGAWSEWWSSFSTHAHVKWIGLIYWVFEKDLPLLYELVNSIVWLMSVVLVYLAARNFFGREVIVARFSVLFLFFPSILLSSTQLLRDPIYILGMCFVTYGWISIYHDHSRWRGILGTIAGFYLIISMRNYTAPIIFSIFFICTVISVYKKKITTITACVMLIGFSFINFQNESFIYYKPFIQKGEINISEVTKKEMIRNGKIAPKNEKTAPKNGKVVARLKYWDKKITGQLNIFRHNFADESYLVNSGTGSWVDLDIGYRTIKDVIAHLPRALQVGFLSPFPGLWISPGAQTGYAGRIVAGFETCIIYAIWFGFLFVLFKEFQILKPLTPVLIFSGVMIVLLGLVIPNVGAIYRMRQGLLVPFFIVGVYGLYIFFLKNKLYKRESSHD